MSRKSRKMTRLWNKVLCPIIEQFIITVGILFAIIVVPNILVWIFF
jgi:hypothetical protein